MASLAAEAAELQLRAELRAVLQSVVEQSMRKMWTRKLRKALANGLAAASQVCASVQASWTSVACTGLLLFVVVFVFTLEYHGTVRKQVC